MLGLQTAVPVYASVVEVKLAVLLVLDDIQIVLAGEEFEGECAELAVRTDIFGLVDDCSDGGVFVFEDFGNEGLEWEPVFAEVQMYCFSL